MKPACEIIVQQVLPAMRATIAKKLTNRYGLSQKAAAQLLGTTQPAISQYRRDLRGCKFVLEKNPLVSERIDELARKIAAGMELFTQTLEFCEICRLLKTEGALCQLHMENDTALKNCEICLGKNQANSR